MTEALSEGDDRVEEGDDRVDRWWQQLTEGARAAYTQVDKMVTTLAAGALAVSLAFIRDLAPQPTATWTLAVSWGTLSLALFATLTSFIASAVAHEKILAQLDDGLSINEIDRSPRAATVTRFLTWLAVGLLIVGVLLLFFFALLNLQQEPPIDNGPSSGNG
jgi:hypothetical protein